MHIKLLHGNTGFIVPNIFGGLSLATWITMQGMGPILVTLYATSMQDYKMSLVFVVFLYNGVVESKSNIQCRLWVDIDSLKNSMCRKQQRNVIQAAN